MSNETAYWLTYEFKVYDPLTTTWNDLPGVYIFAKVNEFTNRWKALYIGETESFKKRPLGSGHEKWADALRLGATYIHARVESHKATRLAVERILIDQENPPLND